MIAFIVFNGKLFIIFFHIQSFFGTFTMTKNHIFWKKTVIVFFLIASTLALYWQVSEFDFVGYDDSTYIALAAKDLSLKTIIWSFTTLEFANWHPLTWLSLILDYNLYGPNASGYHITNLLFHIINTLLLFFLLNKLTGTLYRSAFVAALFALHPLHVESVAWVSERKDVLSAMFWLLTMWAYVEYSQKPKLLTYLTIIILFSLGLMAKPMLVTLPFVLLMMDYWPLNRTSFRPSCFVNKINMLSHSASFLVLEKAPLFILSFASSTITYIAQQKSNAISSLINISFSHRILNAIKSYAVYLEKTFWFQDLMVFYIYPKTFNGLEIAGAILFIVSTTLLAVALLRRAPFVPFGWFWYLGTLIPVIGLIQAGSQAMGDRYTYIPLIGIFIIISWGTMHVLEKIRYGKPLFAFIAVFFLTTTSFAAYHQIAIWKNSITLFKHAVKLNWKNYQACNLLGVAIERLGDDDEALHYYIMALISNSKYVPAIVNIGNILHKHERFDEAAQTYLKALEINPKAVEAEYNLGSTLLKMNRLPDAVSHLEKALAINPDHADAHNTLGVALMRIGNIRKAYIHFREAQRLAPDSEEVKVNLVIVNRQLEKINP